MEPDSKRCTQCDEVKPIGAFAFQSLADDIRHAECIYCHRERLAKYRREFPERDLLDKLNQHRHRLKNLQTQITQRAHNLMPWEELSEVSVGATNLWEQLRVALNRELELVARLHSLQVELEEVA